MKENENRQTEYNIKSFTVRIDMGNAAMLTLKEAAEAITVAVGSASAIVKDINGNQVGKIEYKTKEA